MTMSEKERKNMLANLEQEETDLMTMSATIVIMHHGINAMKDLPQYQGMLGGARHAFERQIELAESKLKTVNAVRRELSIDLLPYDLEEATQVLSQDFMNNVDKPI